MKTLLNHLLIFLAAAVLPGWIYAQEAHAPLSLHPQNHHYFIFRGKPTVLITSGEHYGAVMNADFNYSLYLETIQKEGFNYTRIFIGPYSEMGSDQFGISNNTMNPKPGKWITPWIKDQATQLYDLNQWNPVFFERLKTFIELASSKGIVVEVTLFTSYYVNKHWHISPFYFSNNVNKLDSIPFSRANTLYNGKLMEYEEKYVRKIVQELNPYDNFFFEIQNEPWSDNPNLAEIKSQSDFSWQQIVELANNVSLDWQRNIAFFISDEEKRLPNRHLIAQNMCNFGTRIEGSFPEISIYNFHYAHPVASYGNLHHQSAMSLDETGFMPHNDFTYRRQAWKFMMAGGALYNNLDYSFIAGKEDGTQPIDDRTPGWGGPELRHQYKILKDFMEGLDLIHMKPNPALISGTNKEIMVLAHEGHQYVMYLDDSTHLILSVTPGNYKVEYLDPVSGKRTVEGIVHTKTGTVEMFPSSWEEDLVILHTRITD
jgi:hypothetical protein